jgi:DNA-directed RNA polymerase specialized sigma24 family protein
MSRRLPSSHLKGLPSPSGAKFWPETVWDLVRVARDASGQEREIARKQLLTAYYKPVYRFFGRVLRVGTGRVQDLTQDFFTRFIEKDFLRNVKQEKNFQNFLKLACRRHYINWCEAERVRQGGSRPNVPLDEFGSSAEAPLEEGPFGSILDEELMKSLLASAMDAVREKLVAEGKQKTWSVFEARTNPSKGEADDYASLAKKFSITVYDVGNRLAAGRKLFREALIDVARRRCGDPHEALAALGLQKHVE